METSSMLTYKDRLCCWAIARLLPSGQWIIVARFRDRSDAEGHFKFLRQTIPHAQFDVVFDLSRQSNRLSALANSANSLTSRL
ncbi:MULTISPECIES: hypothetical protein [unclassified Microcoleus]|uniref:hypothetical protein n=1 Tax=unclassified Microcoleus TaxID=2642155 RepID=UPI0025FBACD0|nr:MULTISPECIES: hypothetical protein [unclassified Microcoleus]